MKQAVPLLSLRDQIFPGIDQIKQCAPSPSFSRSVVLRRWHPTSQASSLVESTRSFVGFQAFGCVWIPTAQAVPAEARSGGCTRSRWTDAHAEAACSNYSLVEIAAHPTRAPIPTISSSNISLVRAGSCHSTRDGEKSVLYPLDLLLAEPVSEAVEPADYDLVTGRLNPPNPGDRIRKE